MLLMLKLHVANAKTVVATSKSPILKPCSLHVVNAADGVVTKMKMKMLASC